MNEIANLCERTGANVDMIRVGIGSDSRIGKRFLFPGVGYGGSCFPKDVQALGKTSQDFGYDFKILRSVIAVNERQRIVLAQRILDYFDQNVKDKTIAIWGLAFKPNTDDIREAPALYIIEHLLEAGANIKAFDPEAIPNVEKIFGPKITYCQDQYDAVNNADALVIVTEWSVFRTPNFPVIKKLMNQHIIFDGRNLYALEIMEENGFYYESIGRTAVGVKP